MNNTIFKFDSPKNEPIYDYSMKEHKNSIMNELNKYSKGEIEIPLIIGGKEIFTGKTGTVVMPHNHRHTIATYHNFQIIF